MTCQVSLNRKRKKNINGKTVLSNIDADGLYIKCWSTQDQQVKGCAWGWILSKGTLPCRTVDPFQRQQNCSQPAQLIVARLRGLKGIKADEESLALETFVAGMANLNL